MTVPFTVFGASGFVGAHLVRHLRDSGHDVRTPGREDVAPTGSLGHVVYCIGLTADFRDRPYDTMEAHVGRTAAVLEFCDYRSFLYLSSTRIYGAGTGGSEETPITVDPSDPDALYNISKLAGESLCLSHPSPDVRVARLSNVYGPAEGRSAMAPDNFLASVARDAVRRGRIELRSAADSAKDYIHVGDAVRALERISAGGRHRLYNVASGVDVTAAEILEGLRRLTGCTISVASGGARICYPAIDISRIAAEFSSEASWNPARLMDQLAGLVADCRALSPAGDG